MKTEWWCVPLEQGFKLCNSFCEWWVEHPCGNDELMQLVMAMNSWPVPYAIVSELDQSGVTVETMELRFDYED